tara:strand:- start:486 stop:1013 length:528 start_codon:yes stop_codon:yes gene_type:complete
MHNELPNKYYFINKFDTNYIDKQDRHTALIYRNYTNKIEKRLILKIQKYCRKRGNKFLLSNNIELAIHLNLDGAYIPSFNKNFKHLSYSYRKNFITIGSAHNLKEIKIKERQKVQAIFLSSIFKKNKNFLGVNKFRLLTLLTKKKIIALGGISKTNIKKLNLISCFGFAGISFFE